MIVPTPNKRQLSLEKYVLENSVRFFWFARETKTRAGSGTKHALAALRKEDQLFDIGHLYPQESVQLTIIYIYALRCGDMLF